MKFFRRIGDFFDFLGRLGDEVTFVKPDTRIRCVVNCSCLMCGVTQLVDAPHGQRSCVSCGEQVIAIFDAVGDPEVIT